MQVKGEKASVQQYLCLCNAVGCVHLENCHCEHICDLPFLIFSVCVCVKFKYQYLCHAVWSTVGIYVIFQICMCVCERDGGEFRG